MDLCGVCHEVSVLYISIPFEQPVVGSGWCDESRVNLIGVQQIAHSRRQEWAVCERETVCVCTCV